MRRRGIVVSLIVGMCMSAGAGIDRLRAETNWPGLRGPSMDGAVHDARLFTGAERPALTIAWNVALGPGYSGIAAADGRVVTLFSAGDADVAAAFDAATGKELWRHRIDAAYAGHDGSHGGPLSSPVVNGGRVYLLGARGQLFALDAASGSPVWAKDLVAELGATAPFYGFTSSPVIADGVLVVGIGAGAGKAFGGFDPADGRVLWTAGDDGVEYQSPIAATIDGTLQVLAASGKNLYGLEPKTGRILWSHPHGSDPDAMSGGSIVPVPAGPGRFLIKNKPDSSAMLQVSRGARQDWTVKELWSGNAIRGNYAIPVYNDGFLYGQAGRALTCVDAATGETKWRSREPGDGFPTLVGNHLVVITRPGTLHIVAASPRAYSELASMTLFGEHAWSAVSFAGGHLFARSMAHIARIDVGGSAAAPAATASAASVSDATMSNTMFGRFLQEAGRAADKKAAVDAWMAKQKSFPVVEADGIVHFVYRGKGEDVGIMGDLLGWDREDPMTRLAGTDFFHYSAKVEPDAALTYGLIVDFGKPAADPRNPRAASGVFGDLSALTMPGFADPVSSDEAPAAKRGRLESIEWESAVLKGARRSAQVYLPAGYDGAAARRYPVVYVNDGKTVLEKGGAKTVLDHIMGARVAPAIVVFINPGDGDPGWDTTKLDPYAEMIVKELVPKIDGRFKTRPEAAARAIVGSETMGTAALHTAFSHPGEIARVGSLSAVVIDAKPFERMVQPASATPLVIYQRWGSYDMRSPYEAWDTAQGNREVNAMLRSRGYQPAGGESHGGTGWLIWRAHLADMFATLVPATN